MRVVLGIYNKVTSKQLCDFYFSLPSDLNFRFGFIILSIFMLGLKVILSPTFTKKVNFV